MAKKPIKITEVVLRDAHQSLFATRLRLDDMLPVAAQLDDDALSARADYVVVNIFEEDLEPAVVKLDRIFSHGSK